MKATAIVSHNIESAVVVTLTITSTISAIILKSVLIVTLLVVRRYEYQTECVSLLRCWHSVAHSNSD